MGLIPHAEIETMAQDAIVLDLGDLRAQAQQIIDNAESDARRIREGAEREYEHRVAAARDDGHKEGFASGHEEGRIAGEEAGRASALELHTERLDELCSTLETAIESFHESRDRMLEEAREDVLDFAITLAERVTRRCVALDRHAAVEHAGAALALVLKPSALVITVHPADKETIEQAAPSLLSRFSEPPQSRIETDESLSQGSAVVGTDRGVVEAVVDDEIARLVESVRPAATGASDEV